MHYHLKLQTLQTSAIKILAYLPTSYSIWGTQKTAFDIFFDSAHVTFSSSVAPYDSLSHFCPGQGLLPVDDNTKLEVPILTGRGEYFGHLSEIHDMKVA